MNQAGAGAQRAGRRVAHAVCGPSRAPSGNEAPAGLNHSACVTARMRANGCCWRRRRIGGSATAKRAPGTETMRGARRCFSASTGRRVARRVESAAAVAAPRQKLGGKTEIIETRRSAKVTFCVSLKKMPAAQGPIETAGAASKNTAARDAGESLKLALQIGVENTVIFIQPTSGSVVGIRGTRGFIFPGCFRKRRNSTDGLLGRRFFTHHHAHAAVVPHIVPP